MEKTTCLEKKVIEIQGKLRGESSPDFNRYCLTPRVAIDPKRNLALVIRESQETYPLMRGMDCHYEISLFELIGNDIKHLKHICLHNEWVTNNTNCTKFVPIYDENKGQLCLITQVIGSGHGKVVSEKKEYF